MNLRTKMQQDIIEAMKAKNQQKLEVLRFIFAQIKDEEIKQQRKELTDEEIVKLISNNIKKLAEANELYKKGNRQDLIDKNNQEIEVLKHYLPKQLSDEELEKEIEQIIKDNPDLVHPGVLIGIAVKKLAGKADNSRISKLILSKLKK